MLSNTKICYCTMLWNNSFSFTMLWNYSFHNCKIVCKYIISTWTMLCNIKLHFHNCVESLFQFHHALSHIIFLAGFSECVTCPCVTILKILPNMFVTKHHQYSYGRTCYTSVFKSVKFVLPKYYKDLKILYNIVQTTA